MKNKKPLDERLVDWLHGIKVLGYDWGSVAAGIVEDIRLRLFGPRAYADEDNTPEEEA